MNDNHPVIHKPATDAMSHLITSRCLWWATIGVPITPTIIPPITRTF